MRLSVYSPVTPFHINQHFGANLPCVKDYGLPTQSIVTGPDDMTCPADYTKLYATFGMKGHNGTDLAAGEQNVYSSCDGIVIEKQMVASRGLGIGIITPQPVDLDAGGTHYAKVRTWHLKSFAVDVGQSVKAGDLIGISDNTGYSSGDHVHWELMPMDKDDAGHYNVTFPDNGYAGAIDIEPFYNGICASQIPQFIDLNQKLITVLQQLVGLLVKRLKQ